MTCAQSSLLALVEGRLPPGDRDPLAAHLEDCAACALAVARLRGTKADLAALGTAVPPELDWGRVQAAVMAEVGTEPSPRWRWLVAATAGACALAAVGIGLHVARRPTAPPPTPVAASPAPVAATPLRAVPVLVQGDVRALPGGDELSARVPLEAGAGARVGQGRLALQLGAGTAVVTAAASEIGLRTLDTRDIVIHLPRGKLFAEVAPRAPGQRFVIVTPGHAVAVRGTRYSVERLAAATRVEVTEGEVEVHTVGTGWDKVGARVPQGTVIEFPDGESPAPVVGTGLTAEQRQAFEARARAPLLANFADAASALAASGVIELGASPTAAASVDRRLLGATPLAVRASRGRHVVELARSGFTREVRTIEVGADPQRVAVRLASPGEDNARSAAITRTVRAHLKELRQCYERGLRAHPGIEAVAEIRLTVGENGRVARAAVAPDSVLPESVMTCLVDAVGRWTFTRGPQVTVVYPLVLRPELSFETP
jgi:ferric-dicitrate binding protein FerR (iron transport regulator)